MGGRTGYLGVLGGCVTIAVVTGSLPPTDQPAEPNPPEDAGVAGSVTGEWVEVYPPDFVPPEDAPADFDPAEFGGDGFVDAEGDPGRGSGLSTGLFVASLLLVLAGSITPLFQLSLEYGPSHTNLSDVLTASAWQLSVADQAPGETLTNHTGISPLLIGVPLLLCALLVIAVVVLRLRVARASEPARVVRTARVVGVVAAAFLAGLVFAVGMFETAWATFGSLSELGALSTTIGTGFWLLVLAAVVGIAAAALGFRTAGVGHDEPGAEEPLPPPVIGDEFGQFGPQGGSEEPMIWEAVAVIPDYPANPNPPGVDSPVGFDESVGPSAPGRPEPSSDHGPVGE
jgi:hypothetical protein